MAECKLSCMAKKAIAKGNEEDVWDLMDETFENLKHRYPDLYNQIAQEYENLAFKISPDEARAIVRDMKPRGEMYSLNEVHELLQKYQIKYRCEIEYYLCVNMMANDYYATAKKFGLERNDEFYLCLAHDFIDDIDGKPFKVQRYFLD